MNNFAPRTLSALVLACCAASAHAGMDKAGASIGHTDYSDGRGYRSIASVETSGSFDATTLVLEGATGKRHFGDDVKASGSRLRATAYHDWGEALSTRTSAALSTHDPVFANRDFAHDFNIKVIPNTVLTAGGRYSDYDDGASVKAWSAGATYYMSRLSASYRYTGYDVSTGGTSHGHTASFRLKDANGMGSSQLWLGKGSTVHDYDWLPELQAGKLEIFTLRRVQPLNGKLALDVTLGKTWYDTPVSRFHGVTAKLGASYNW